MVAPNVNGRLQLTGVHQKPPAFLVVYETNMNSRNMSAIQLPICGPWTTDPGANNFICQNKSIKARAQVFFF